jgi:hypothetical protein
LNPPKSGPNDEDVQRLVQCISHNRRPGVRVAIELSELAFCKIVLIRAYRAKTLVALRSVFFPQLLKINLGIGSRDGIGAHGPYPPFFQARETSPD